MLRSTRPLLSISVRGLPRASASIGHPAASQTRRSVSGTQWRTSARVLAASSSRQLVPFIQRAQFAAKNEPDTRFEKETAEKKLESHPEEVTSKSTVRPSFEGPEEMRPRSPSDAGDIGMAGVKKDLNTLKDTLSLDQVPLRSYQLGLAGTLPYLGTSIATVYLSWALNTQWPSQSQFLNHILMSHESAAHYLHLLEPIQVGYGAVIISFLGAIHWGLEYAEKTPNDDRAKFRYGLGVLASAVAWPTVMLPVQLALTAQFAAFTFLYFADARATTRGWAPTWYASYRFVLTLIVGAAILMSLVGREKIGADQPRLTGLREKFHKEGHDPRKQEQWEKMEAEEKEKNRKKEEEKKKEEEEKQKEQEAKEKKGKQDKGGEKKEDKNEAKGEGKDEGSDNAEDEQKDEGGDKKEGDGGDEKEKEGGDEQKDEQGEDQKQDNEEGDDKKDDKGDGKKDAKSK